MVLWGLSLLAVSLSFVAYRHASAIWAKIPLSSGRATPLPKPQDQSEGNHASKKGEDDGEGAKDTPVLSPESASPPSIAIDSLAELESPDSTPKARSTRLEPNVPSFSLNASDESLKKGSEKPEDASAFREGRPASLGQSKPSTSELMPPPKVPLPRKTSSTAAQPSRIPATGPLPNRGPSTARPTNSLAVPSGTLPPTLNSRNKVALAPGRSSIDWAQLTKKNTNLSGVPYLQRVTPLQLKQMNGRKGRPVWASYHGRVYNLTPYVPFHPGGEGEILRAAGKDAEKLFNEIHAYVNWENMLGQCCVGIMVTENEEQSRQKYDWEAMD